MKFTLIKTIIDKDWKELLKSKQAVLPMILVPVLLIIVIPAALLLSISNADVNYLKSANLDQFLRNIPQTVMPQGFNEKQSIVYAMVNFFFAPLFLIIPIMISSIVAANSFAGEKEQKTIEGLLYTPISDKELIMGKILVSLAPSILISWISFLFYCLLVNLTVKDLLNDFLFPNLTWLLMILLLVPAVSFLSLSLIILVSQKAKSVMEAQQISGLLVLPVVGLIVSQAVGLIYLNPKILILVSTVLFLADTLIYRYIVNKFNREEIVVKLL